jgi:hypothetical protein
MEIDDEEIDESQLLVVNLQVEFYLKGREDPLQCYMAAGAPREVFEHGIMTGIWALMDEATGMLITDMDSKQQTYLFVTDKRMNRFVLDINEIQSVSLLTPDKEVIAKALQSGEDEDDE